MAAEAPDSTGPPGQGVLRCEVRAGAYADSVVLMQLRAELARLPGVVDAGAAMGSPVNLDLLEGAGLLPPEAAGAGPDDLVVAVRGATAEQAEAALAKVDALLARTRAAEEGEGDYRPRRLATALRMLPEAGWVLVSVPGRWAARVAGEALEAGRHVFLYSDNVPVAEEADLKRRAAERGLLVMGPDCGTAILAGVGFGFANRVRRGPIGLVGASGTGIQAIASSIDGLGGGISHAIGTGGRDLAAEVGGVTSRQGLELLGADPETRVVVLVSKPPADEVLPGLLATAAGIGKPVVVCFLGWLPPARRIGPLSFAVSLGEAAERALELAAATADAEPLTGEPAPGRGPYLRGLFAGGTLALASQQALRPFLRPLWSNVPIPGVTRLADPGAAREHTILDLGDDELTAGRLHPMLDQDLLLRRLEREAADPEVGVLLLDLVLGDGAHPDPAARLAPAIERLRRAGGPQVALVVVGTADDPQDLASQRERLEAAGARLFPDPQSLVPWLLPRLGWPPLRTREGPAPAPPTPPVAAVNVGLEMFHRSLLAQGARAVQVEWRPPAGGNEKLLAILERMGT